MDNDELGAVRHAMSMNDLRDFKRMSDLQNK